MKMIFTLVLLITTNLILFSQNLSLKEKALSEFKSEHYYEAIALLEEALISYPNDAEIYYYLGWFNHYQAYDSRPLRGYDFTYSKRIFDYLEKAIELNPNYGDAKYFFGAECSGNAFVAMQNYDLIKLKYFYQLANGKGAYPLWLKEFGRNILSNCEKNAILFTGGNADFDICSYLQFCENYRTDITVIPIGNIDRPWYVQFIKRGIEGGVKKVNINLTDQQIMDIHPFKWDSTTIAINVFPKYKHEFNLPDNTALQWIVAPDLFSERLHSKIETEIAKKRTYLSPQRAILLQIIEDNYAQRPIYFSNFASPTFYGGLDEYFQNCGLVSRLLPFKTKGTNYSLYIEKLEQLIQQKNLQDFSSVIQNNIPRISGITNAYLNIVYELSHYYKSNKDNVKLTALRDLFNTHLKIGFNPEFEENLVKELNN